MEKPALSPFVWSASRLMESSQKENIMTKDSIFKTAGAAVMVVLCALPVLGRDHSAWNGTWELVPARSNFAGEPVVQTGTVTIKSDDRIIIVERNFKYTGIGETYFYSDVTDANGGATIRAGKDLKSKTKWDHDVLMVTTTLDGAVTVERYNLAANGSMMVNVTRPGRKSVELAFERK